jgi:hypothetical protein
LKSIMKKLVLGLSLTLLLALLHPTSAKASIITINNKGEVVLNVLASEIALGTPQKQTIEVNKVANNLPSNQQLVLKKDNGKVSLSSGSNTALDVTNWKDDLIDIEQRGEVSRVSISLDNGSFLINQQGVSATTDYPIKIDPQENKIMVETAQGNKFLAVLPFDAAQSALRTKAITKVSNQPFLLSEEDSNLSYTVSGDKELNLFHIYNLKIPVQAKISASTGEVYSTNEPVWLKIVSYFLS